METLKTEEQKSVPIDTSGKSVDVELQEEVKANPNIKEVDSNITIVEETQEESLKPESTDENELEEYSTGVKKRI